MNKSQHTVIIGAGPAGLAISALLTQRKISHEIIEKESYAGGLYARLNPELPLLSPVFFNSLPLSKYFDPNGKNTVGNYHLYLKDYILQHRPPLLLNTTVSKVIKAEDTYQVYINQSDVIQCSNLIVATGMSSFPRALDFIPPDNIELQTGDQWMGLDYYRNKNCLIMGSGTSAFELATLLAKHTKVWLATNKPITAAPLKIAGINIHFFVRLLELIPLRFSSDSCQSGFRELPINQSIKNDIKRGLIHEVKKDFEFKEGMVKFSNGMKDKVDVVINCTGYHYDLNILPQDVKTHSNGNIHTLDCQSISHSGLYFIGFPCSGGHDSKFLRGIYRDAYRISEQITD